MTSGGSVWPAGDAPSWVICNLFAWHAGREEWLDYHHYKEIPTLINNRQNNRRRGRGGGPRPNGVNPGNDRGNRIDNRARGNANQLYEKYKTLARDAQMQGDRVLSEYYFQFADHYFRVLSESRSRFEDQRRFRDDQGDRDDQEEYGDENYPVEVSNGNMPARPYAEDDGDGAGEREQVEARPEPQYQPERQSRPERQPRPERQQRSERQPQVERQSQPERANEANGHEQPVEKAARTARGRRPKAENSQYAMPIQQDEQERIEVDRLPPAFAAPEPEIVAEPVVEKPKRRGRPPRAAASTAEV